MTTPAPVPCNDCGHSPVVYTVSQQSLYYMKCCKVGCGKGGPKASTQDEAAQKWNNQERWDGVEPIPEDYKSLSLEHAKAIAQAAAKRLTDCTRKEVLNDVWAAAVNNIIQEEIVKFLDWMFNKRERQIRGLLEDSYSPEDVWLSPDPDTINMLVSEFAAYRKPV